MWQKQIISPKILVCFKVCYFAQHHICFAYSQELEKWIMYDDETVKVTIQFKPHVSICICLCLSFSYYREIWAGGWLLGWCNLHVRKRAFATSVSIFRSCKVVFALGRWLESIANQAFLLFIQFLKIRSRVLEEKLRFIPKLIDRW